MARKLKDIDVEEISIVDRAANRKLFAIVKRRQQMDELIELLKSIYGDEITDEAIAKAAELPKENLSAIKGALNLLNKYLDGMPEDVKSAIKTLGKYASYGYPAAKVEKGEELTLEKVGAKLSKATMEELKKLRDILAKAFEEGKGLKKAHEILTALLGNAEVEKNSDPAIQAKLEKLALYEEQEKLDLEKSEKTKEDAKEARIKKLEDELVELKKTKGHSKVIKGQDGKDGDDNDADDKTDDKWSSFSIGALEEE